MAEAGSAVDGDHWPVSDGWRVGVCHVGGWEEYHRSTVVCVCVCVRATSRALFMCVDAAVRGKRV